MGLLEPKGVSFVDREEAHTCKAHRLFLTYHTHTWFSEEQADFVIFVRECVYVIWNDRKRPFFPVFESANSSLVPSHASE